MDRKYAYRWAEVHKDEQFALLKELAAIPAPSHHEDKRVAFIKDWLDKNGAEGVYVDEAKNVIIPFGNKPGDSVSVFCAHTDVVFPDTTPLPVKEEGGRLWAPGVGDDTANAVALLFSALFVIKKQIKPVKPVIFVLNSCEEGLGNLKGVRQICKDYKVKELISFDGTWDGVVSRAVGSERWEVSVKTQGGHSYGNFGNRNAIEALAGMITKLYEQTVPPVEGAKTTYNVGVISGGTSVNTIAQNAKMLYEYRSDDYGCLETMRNKFNEIFESCQTEDARFERVIVGERPCGRVEDKAALDELLNYCRDCIKDVTGTEPSFYPSSTDANIPLSLGVPATTFGTYLGDGAHTREEYVEISSLNTGLKLALAAISRCF